MQCLFGELYFFKKIICSLWGFPGGGYFADVLFAGVCNVDFV
jgi:hypothetical protein